MSPTMMVKLLQRLIRRTVSSRESIFFTGTATEIGLVPAATVNPVVLCA
jgi:hypothetical protein